jgi:glycine cleavage system regulatory protein
MDSTLLSLAIVASTAMFIKHHLDIKKLKSRVHALEHKNKRMMGKA